jgi:hypothetical protein
MRWPFQHLDQLGHAAGGPLGRQSDLFGLDSKRVRLDRRGGLLKPGAQELIHRLLQGLAGAAYLSFEEGCYVIVDGQGCSHIMMFSKMHHDVNMVIRAKRRFPSGMTNKKEATPVPFGNDKQGELRLRGIARKAKARR